MVSVEIQKLMGANPIHHCNCISLNDDLYVLSNMLPIKKNTYSKNRNQHPFHSSGSSAFCSTTLQRYSFSPHAPFVLIPLRPSKFDQHENMFVNWCFFFWPRPLIRTWRAILVIWVPCGEYVLLLANGVKGIVKCIPINVQLRCRSRLFERVVNYVELGSAYDPKLSCLYLCWVYFPQRHGTFGFKRVAVRQFCLSLDCDFVY